MEELCEYEKQREERIARNREVMRQMGLVDMAAQFTALLEPCRQKAAVGRSQCKTASERAPLRRSLRLRDLSLQPMSPQAADQNMAAPRCNS